MASFEAQDLGQSASWQANGGPPERAPYNAESQEQLSEADLTNANSREQPRTGRFRIREES